MKKAAGAYPEAHAAAVVGNGPVNLLAMLAHGVESTTNPIWITDLEDRFIFVNRSFLRTYGHTEKEVLGNHLATLFSPANPPTLLPEILEKTRHGGWRGEALHRHNDGLEFPVFLNTSKIKSRTGEIIGLMGVAEDITAHRYAESHIHLLANAVESTEEMISITDCDNRFTFVNKAFQKKYGYTQAEVWGQTPEILRSSTTSPSTSKEIRRETLKGGWRGELMNRRKDGTDFPIHLSTSAIKNRKGETIGLVGVARDVTGIVNIVCPPLLSDHGDIIVWSLAFAIDARAASR
jgi:PAS domain S-box-containing protein